MPHSDTNWDYVSDEEAREMAIEAANHECDHSQCIPRSKLPELPSCLKDCDFSESLATTRLGRSFVNLEGFPMIEVPNHEVAEWLSALVMTCYGEGE